jgi:hypothetical protein
MDGPRGRPGADRPAARKIDRAERLAQALRENLRKRKAQSRARSGTGDGGPENPGERPKIDTDNSEER